MDDGHTIAAGIRDIVVDADGKPIAMPKQGIGSPQRRHDGADKVTGKAVYAGEETPPGMLHAVMVLSSTANGEVLRFDTRAALATPGVVRVLTPDDVPPLGNSPVPPAAQSYLPMTDRSIRYDGQPLAIVLAERLEQAEEAAALVVVETRRESPTTFETATAETPNTDGNGYAFAPIDVSHGDPTTATAASAASIDQTYVAPIRHHNMMEPSATLAYWRGDELHMHDATQWTYGVRYALSGYLGISPDNIHVRCPYTGGGFGAKGYVWPHQILAAVASRLIERPVKLVIGRDGCYSDTGYQSVVVSRITLAANATGELTAIEHDTENVTSTFDDYVEFGNAGTRGMYACPNYRMTTRVRRAHVATPTAMRAPHEGPGMFATESAMDELAYKLGMDPLELRLANYSDTDMLSGKPFSSKRLREAYLEGARRIGWSDRKMTPRSHSDGHRLIGYGMASAIMTTFRFACAARAALNSDGTVDIEAGTQEIGTGTRTILAQVAAERLNLPADRISVTLGSTALPETGGTFGSSTTISVGSAVAAAADKLLERIRDLSGEAQTPSASAWADLLRATGVERLQAEGAFTLPGGAGFDAHGGASDYSMHTYGAIFVQMEVDEDLGLARMRRAVGVYSAGRILNPVTARSQMIGGIVWGYGRAMLEVSAMDERYARYLSKNLSGVMLPVNADIPRDIDVAFIDENDPRASLIGVRGIGELGEVGVAAAITNALYHATGKRIRDLPVRFEHLLA